MTQCDALLAFLREYERPPSSLEITGALLLVNVTGRISDLRKRGHRIDCVKVDGVDRYVLVEEPQQLTWAAEFDTEVPSFAQVAVVAAVVGLTAAFLVATKAVPS